MRRKNLLICSLMVCCMILTTCCSTLTANAKGFQPSTSNGHGYDINIHEEANKQTVVGVIQSVDESSITVSVMGRAKNNKIEEVVAEDEYGIMLIEELLEEKMEEGMTEDSSEESTEMESSEIESSEDDTLVEEENTEENSEEETEEENDFEQEKSDVKVEPNATVQTIPVTDSTIILDTKHNEITLSELSISSMVIIKLDENGNAISIALSDKWVGDKKPEVNNSDKQNEFRPGTPNQPQRDKHNPTQRNEIDTGNKNKRGK